MSKTAAAAKAVAGDKDLLVRLATLEADNATLRKQLAAKPTAAATAVAAAVGMPKTNLIPGREAADLTAKLGHKPKYALTEKAYIGDILYDPENGTHPVTKRPRVQDPESGEFAPLLVDYEGIPGAHMMPMNEAAKEMCVRYAKQHGANINPVDGLTIVGPGATVLQPQK